MLHLYPNSTKIIKAKREYYSEMKSLILKRVDRINKIKSPTFNTRRVELFFNKRLSLKIEDILIGLPSDIISLNEEINSLFLSVSPDLQEGIKYIFNYDWFITKTKKRYDAYNLAESLDINTCTYCNRNYTNTVITDKNTKITRPQFDHYFDKKTYPLLALSFYNLIPSCSICNSGIKGTEPMDLDKHLHPYLDNEIENLRFTYKYSKNTSSGLEIKLVTPTNSKLQKTVNLFAIEEIYNTHTSDLSDLIKIKNHFSEKYLSILDANLLKGVIISKEEMYRIVFATEHDSTKFVNRPLSKFKYDILKELGVI